jgi:hypothetical protein
LADVVVEFPDAAVVALGQGPEPAAGTDGGQLAVVATRINLAPAKPV